MQRYPVEHAVMFWSCVPMCVFFCMSARATSTLVQCVWLPAHSAMPMADGVSSAIMAYIARPMA